jgi:large subunit ribosomal protein L9
MEVILLERIRNLGALGDKVKVKAGFGRNFLIPQRKAVPATAANLKQFEARRAEFEKAAELELKNAQERSAHLVKMGKVTIAVRAAEEGKLYGSIGTHELTAAINKAGFEIEKSEILLPQGSLRMVGEYDIDIYLHSDVITPVKINIVAE